MVDTKNKLRKAILNVRFSGKNKAVYCENLNYFQTQCLFDFLYHCPGYTINPRIV